jgi:hypothetical protein
MPRSFGGLVSGMARASIRAAEQARRAAERERQREQRRIEKEAKESHRLKRQSWVDSQNAELKQKLSDLLSIVNTAFPETGIYSYT